MTSNRPLEEWGKLLGDVPAATAILDRFLHHAQVITIKGRSYRLRQWTPGWKKLNRNPLTQISKNPIKSPPGGGTL